MSKLYCEQTKTLPVVTHWKSLYAVTVQCAGTRLKHGRNYNGKENLLNLFQNWKYGYNLQKLIFLSIEFLSRSFEKKGAVGFMQLKDRYIESFENNYYNIRLLAPF